MNKKIWALLPFAVFIAVACQEDKPASPASAQPPVADATTKPADSGVDPAKAAAATPASTAGTTAGSAPPASPTVTSPGTAPAPEALPAALKSEGYEYDGLSNTKPMDMQMVMSTRSDIVTGSQSVSLKEVKDGKAVYTVERTGGLAALGTEEWLLTKDGVFTTKSSVLEFSPNAMELPAVPKPGMTWKVHAKGNETTAKMDEEITFKIIGKRKVTTKVGSYDDALQVEQDSTGTLQGKNVRTVSQNWYVKGLGLVKAEMKTFPAIGKSDTITIQETKH